VWAGEHTFFFFFPEEAFLGIIYFYFRLGILQAGIGIIFFLPILNVMASKKKKLLNQPHPRVRKNNKAYAMPLTIAS